MFYAFKCYLNLHSKQKTCTNTIIIMIKTRVQEEGSEISVISDRKVTKVLQLNHLFQMKHHLQKDSSLIKITNRLNYLTLCIASEYKSPQQTNVICDKTGVLTGFKLMKLFAFIKSAKTEQYILGHSSYIVKHAGHMFKISLISFQLVNIRSYCSLIF